MVLRALLVLSLMLAAGAALAMPAGAQRGLPPTPDPGIAGGATQRALDQARARWSRLKIRNYDYEVLTTCFCPRTGWVPVKVRNGVPSRRSVAHAGRLATIPRIFRQIQRAIDAPVYRLTVEYGARGMPVDVFMDQIQNAIDDENGFGVRRFRRR